MEMTESPTEIKEDIRESLCQLEQEMKIDNLKSDKNKIKRRRSSFGKHILRPPCASLDECGGSPRNLDTNDGCISGAITSSCLTEAIDPAGVTTTQSHSMDHSLPSDRESKVENEEIVDINKPEKGEEKLVSPIVEAYQKKSKQLEEEYKIWKRLVKARKSRVREAERELRDSKRGETVIEEEHVMPHLRKEQKAIILSRPNYSQYLQEVKHVKDLLILKDLEVEKVLRHYQKFITVSKSASQASFSRIEEELLGDLRERNPKELLRALMET